MKAKSEIFGGVVTGVYLLCVCGLVYWKRATLSTLELNAIGDFLAGVFGPIAFLWLVLGYLQQGRELKLSSEALILQAVELKNSVEQQKELVFVTKLQVDSELERLRSIREKREKEIMPELVVSVGSCVCFGNECFTGFELLNDGAAIFKVAIEFGGRLNNLSCVIPEWPKGKVFDFKIKFNTDEPLIDEVVTIAYSDADFQTKVAYLEVKGFPSPGENKFAYLEVNPRISTSL